MCAGIGMDNALLTATQMHDTSLGGVLFDASHQASAISVSCVSPSVASTDLSSALHVLSKQCCRNLMRCFSLCESFKLVDSNRTWCRACARALAALQHCGRWLDLFSAWMKILCLTTFGSNFRHRQRMKSGGLGNCRQIRWGCLPDSTCVAILSPAQSILLAGWSSGDSCALCLHAYPLPEPR